VCLALSPSRASPLRRPTPEGHLCAALPVLEPSRASPPLALTSSIRRNRASPGEDDDALSSARTSRAYPACSHRRATSGTPPPCWHEPVTMTFRRWRDSGRPVYPQHRWAHTRDPLILLFQFRDSLELLGHRSAAIAMRTDRPELAPSVRPSPKFGRCRLPLPPVSASSRPPLPPLSPAPATRAPSRPERRRFGTGRAPCSPQPRGRRRPSYFMFGPLRFLVINKQVCESWWIFR
jgi:hypothetical protein